VAAAAAGDAIALGELRVTDAQLVNMTMWAAMHGVAEVLLMGFDADPVYAETLTASVIDTMVAGLVAPGAVTGG
jgi:hypothetical protein